MQIYTKLFGVYLLVASYVGRTDETSSSAVNSVSFLPSLPTRGAWIEIRTGGVLTSARTVAPHTGSVD